ncbi:MULTISPECIES: helix-turn-helix domain-containing protein [unclassified Streptomyces]|uniref:helix-turn-helix domain-containing protein n=1 Tax=unclassified Streptomyces TaxID=2593676 RepID=UPI0016612E42|nr:MULTISPECIES: helix-turn-helix transcriptional regulator [unclassified Streptomyces]MBD0708879.1 transcriptional regulator [Streptomyces sp. CBMA291]MBD0715978.1 transcriptional regulator [Streptomyces sp. CBMA370]
MVNVRELDPNASPLDYFGAELRRLREEAGLTQQQLGNIIYCTGSLIGQIETAKKVPTRRFAEQLDAALMTAGHFSRLIGLVLKSQLPAWFQPYADLEAKATYISTYQSQLVYGLLQTPEYARAVLSIDHSDRLDELVAARMERQRVLDREHPPVVCVVLDEAVLHRQIGGAEVMKKQLEYLLTFRDHPWVQVQVLPFGAGQHSAMMGSFNLLRFDGDPDIFYSPGYGGGHMTADPQVIRERSVSYARLQATALSREESAVLIERVMKERYGHQPGPAVA